MNRRIVHILLLGAFGLVLTATAKYLPISVVVGGVMVIVLIFFTQSFISIRKKALAAGQISGVQKVSSAIIYASLLGFVIALMLIVFHIHYIGRPLLNFSLVLFIAGIVVGIFAQIKSGNGSTNPALKQQAVFGTIIYLGIICTTVGMLLRLNHYPDGKYLMIGGLSFIVVFLIFLIAYKKYAHRSERAE